MSEERETVGDEIKDVGRDQERRVWSHAEESATYSEAGEEPLYTLGSARCCTIYILKRSWT